MTLDPACTLLALRPRWQISTTTAWHMGLRWCHAPNGLLMRVTYITLNIMPSSSLLAYLFLTFCKQKLRGLCSNYNGGNELSKFISRPIAKFIDLRFIVTPLLGSHVRHIALLGAKFHHYACTSIHPTTSRTASASTSGISSQSCRVTARCLSHPSHEQGIVSIGAQYHSKLHEKTTVSVGSSSSDIMGVV